MQLTTYDAVRLGFVLDEHQGTINPEPYKNKSSFDVEVREIIYKDDNDVINRKPSLDNLKPQNSAYLISKQYIRVPEGYIAYVFLKNRMSQRGLLALNTGIIDQNYYGPVSTLILNLSNRTTEIPNRMYPTDLSFFRIVFHKVDKASEGDAPKFSEKKYEYNEYINARIKEFEYLPKTFLNAHEIEERVKKEVTEKAKEFSINRLLCGVAVVGLLLSILPIGRDVFFTWAFDLKEISALSTENKYKTNSLVSEIERLKTDIAELKRNKDLISAYQTSVEPVTTQNMQISSEQLKKTQSADKEMPSKSSVVK